MSSLFRFQIFLCPFTSRLYTALGLQHLLFQDLLANFMGALFFPNLHFPNCAVINGEASTDYENFGTVVILKTSKQNSSTLYLTTHCISSFFQYALRQSWSSLFGFLLLIFSSVCKLDVINCGEVCAMHSSSIAVAVLKPRCGPSAAVVRMNLQVQEL